MSADDVREAGSAPTEPSAAEASAVRGPQVDYSQSGGLVGRLAQLGVSIAISSYQFGLLYMPGRNPSGGLHVHQTALPKPMGLAWEGEGRLTVACGMQVPRLENVHAPHEQINKTFIQNTIPERNPMIKSQMRTDKAGNSNHFIDNVREALLCGGRLTKWKGKVASIAPMMGGMAVSVSHLALATGLAVVGIVTTTGTAQAACSNGGTPQIFTNGDDGVSCDGLVTGFDALAGNDGVSIGTFTTNTTMSGNYSFGDGRDFLQIYAASFGAGRTFTTVGPITLDMGREDDLVIYYTFDVPIILNGTTLLGEGSDVFGITDNFTIIGDILGGEGNDLIQIGRNGFGNLGPSQGVGAPSVVGNIFGGSGSDIVTVSDKATIDGSIFGGDDIDSINLVEGKVTGNVDWGDGDESGTIDLTGVTLGGSLVFGDGTDIFSFSAGTVGQSIFLGSDADAGTGDDIFTLAGGSVTQDLIGDGDQDTFKLNSGRVGGDVNGYSGNDFIALDGAAIAGIVAGGDGDDAFTWSSGTLGSFDGGDGSDTALITAAEYDTITLLDGGDDVSATDGMIDALTLSGLTTTVAGATIINWENVVVDGGSLSLTDDALTTGSDAGTGLFILNGGSVDGGDMFALTGNLSIGVGSLFLGTGGGAGVYTISGTVLNNGTITTLDGAVGDMVSIAGNYDGQSGLLLMDVDTATDSADTLAIAGGSSGTTGVLLNNLSPNAATGNDITLITVAGTSTAGDFFLADGPLIAGAFQYDLESLPGSFVLASALSSTGAVYEAAPHVLLDGFTRMPTLEQRVGQRRWAATEGEAGTLEATSGGWLRIHGDWADAELNSGTSYETDSWGLQAGIDLPSEAGENGQWVFGLTAQTGNVSSDVATATGTGSVDAESFGLGVTATWYGYDAFYVDMQAQMNWASVDYASSVQGILAEGEKATTGAASIEIGKRFALNETSGLTPQAQLTWGSVKGDNFTDSVSNTVGFGTNERLIGRIGLAYDKQWQGANQGTMQNVYGIVNILQDFSNSASVNVAGATLATEGGATWGEIGLGGSYSWDDGKRLYGEVSYREELGSGSGSALVATAGVQIQW